MRFVGVTPSGYTEQFSKFYYGGNATLDGGEGPQYTQEGAGVVSYERIPLPEPSTGALCVMSLGFLIQRRVELNPRHAPHERRQAAGGDDAVGGCGVGEVE